MPSLKERSDDDRPRRGLARDLHNIRAGTAATSAELSEFLHQFKGKSPQEVLGLVAQSQLVQSVSLATALTLVLLIVGTAGPYALAKLNPPPPKPKPAPAAEAADQPAATDAADGATDATAPAGVEGAPAGASQEVLEALDMDESRTTDPGVNPLENQGDDLLNDLE